MIISSSVNFEGTNFGIQLDFLNSGEFEVDSLAGESVVDRGERVQLVFQRGGVLRVKENFHDLGAIGVETDSFAGDLGRVNQVL